MNSKFNILFKNELKKYLKMKKNIISMLITFMVVSYIVLYFLSVISDRVNTINIRVCCEDKTIFDKIYLEKEKIEGQGIELYNGKADLTQVKKGKVGIIVNVDSENNTIEIINDDMLLSSEDLYYKAVEVAAVIGTVLNDKASSIDYNIIENSVVGVDLASENSILKATVLAIVFYLVFMSMEQISKYIENSATNSFAGEVEKGIRDSIVLTGTSTKSIVLSKYLFLFILSFLLVIVQAIIMIIAIKTTSNEVTNLIKSVFSQNIIWIIVLVVMAAQVGLITSGICSLISSFFTKIRHSNMYMLIWSFLLIGLVIAGFFLESSIISYIPISNISNILIDAAMNNINYLYLFVSSAISLVVYFVCMAISCKVVERRV